MQNREGIMIENNNNNKWIKIIILLKYNDQNEHFESMKTKINKRCKVLK